MRRRDISKHLQKYASQHHIQPDMFAFSTPEPGVVHIVYRNSTEAERDILRLWVAIHPIPDVEHTVVLYWAPQQHVWRAVGSAGDSQDSTVWVCSVCGLFNTCVGHPIDDRECPLVKFKRAGGDVECIVCKKPYRKHKHSPHKTANGDPWLHVLCDGTLVKL